VASDRGNDIGCFTTFLAVIGTADLMCKALHSVNRTCWFFANFIFLSEILMLVVCDIAWSQPN